MTSDATVKEMEDVSTQKDADGLNSLNDNSLPSNQIDVEKGKETEIVDPNLVTWSSSSDPANPKNWPKRSKWIVTILNSLFLLATLMSSTIISPALPSIASSLDITGDVELQTTMSIFVLGYSFGPLFLAPLSEMYGRIVIIHVSNVWFILWNLVCGFAVTKTQMIVARLMAGIGGSAALALGGGIISDIWLPSQRGHSLALYGLIPLLGPAIGPLAGGYIAQRLNWSWSFWILSIFTTFLVLVSLILFHETYAPTILHKRAKSLRKTTNNPEIYTVYEKANPVLLTKLKIALIRPTKQLFQEPVIQLMSLYSAYSFGILYIVHSTFPTMWKDVYHQDMSHAGLNFISIAVGFSVGGQIAGPTQDMIFKYLRKRSLNLKTGEDKTKEEMEVVPVVPEWRLPLMFPAALFVPIGLLIYGWSAQYHTHFIWPNIGIAIVSGAMNIFTQCQNAYMIDAYPEFPASALAAVNVLKYIAGFAFPLFALQLYDKLDWGWGNTLLAGLAIVLSLPMILSLWAWGHRIRGLVYEMRGWKIGVRRR